MMNFNRHRICVTALAIGIASIAHSNVAQAEGAIAVGILNNDARLGYASGWSRNQSNAAAAQELALRNCRTLETAPQNVRDTCKIVRTFSNQCVMVALDPENGTPGAGWAVAPTRALAEQEAKRECERTAGPGRQGKCTDTDGVCDGTAR